MKSLLLFMPLFFVFKFWMVILLGVVLLKFVGRSRCGGHHSNRKTRPDLQDRKNGPLFREEDIVPDGQSGF